MPANKRPVMVPIEGIDYSQPAEFMSDRGGFPKNFRIYRDQLKKQEGFSVYGAVSIASSNPILGLGVLQKPDGTKYILRASKTDVEYYDTATSLWTDINSAALIGGDSDFMSFANIPESGLIVMSNGVNAPFKWDGTGNIAAFGGAVPHGKHLCWATPYLIIANMTDAGNEFPFKLQWCDTDDITNWTTGNSGEVILSKDPSEIKAVKVLSEYVAVYKRDSLWLGRKVESDDIFVFDCVYTGDGLFADRAVADVDGVHYFMGKNDFWRWNGASKESIGEKVRDEVFRRINRNSANQCHAVHMPEFGEVWFYVCTTGQSYPTEIYKYNYRKGFWFMSTCTNVTASVKWFRVDTETWATRSGTWAEAQDAWGDGYTAKDWEELIVGRSNGHTYKLNFNTVNDAGEAVSAEFVSKDFLSESLELYTRWIQLDVWAKGYGKVYAYYSIDGNQTWVNIPFDSTTAYATLTEAYAKIEFYPDIVTDKISFKFVCDGAGEVVYIKNFMPYYISREERKA